MPSVFGRTVEDLLSINFAQGALFLFGLVLTLLQQKTLEPEGYCRSRMYEHYVAVVSLSYVLVFTVFASWMTSSFVKARVPDAADGGLHGLGAKTRRMLRAFASIGLFLNVAASVLALVTYTFVLQAKLGLFECLPAATKAGVYIMFVVVGSVLVVSYVDNAKVILTAAQ